MNLSFDWLLARRSASAHAGVDPRETDGTHPSRGAVNRPYPDAGATSVTSVLESLPVMFAAVDGRGQLVHWNQECERVTGLNLRAAAEGNHLPAMLRAADRGIGISTETCSGGTKGLRETLSYQSENGPITFVQWRELPFAPDPAWAVCAVGKDVTEYEWARRQQNLLTRMMNTLGTSDRLETAIRQILRDICEFADMDLGEAWRPNPSRGAMEFWTAWHGGDGQLVEFVWDSKHYSFPPGVGLPGRAWRDRKPEWMIDLPDLYDRMVVRTEMARKAGIRSIFTIPLVADNEVIAVFVFLSKRRMPHEPRIAQAVETVSFQIVNTILRRQAVEAAELIADRYRMVSETTTDLIYSYAVDSSGALSLEWHAGGTHSGLNSRHLREGAGPNGCWADIVVDDDRPVYEERIRRLRTGHPSVDEFRIFINDERFPRWVRASGTPVIDPLTGRVIRIVGSATDITDEKVAGEKLHRRERALEERVREISCSQRVSQELWHSGKPLEAALLAIPGIVAEGMQFPEIAAVSLLLDGQEYATGNFAETPWTLDVPVTSHGRKVGAFKIAYLEFRPRERIGPFLKEEVNLVTDIARRIGIAFTHERYVSALRTSEQRYQAVVEAQSELIFRITPKARKCVFCNDALSRFLGKSEAEIVNGPLSDLIDTEELKAVKAKLRKVDAGNPTAVHSGTMTRQDGRQRFISWHYTGIFDADRRLMEVQAVGRDVTEQVEAERALEESRRREIEQEWRLEQAQRTILAHEMSAGFAHQVNQPLNSASAFVGSCLQKLRRKYPEDVELSGSLDRALAQIQATGEQVKEFSRLLSSPNQVPEHIDLNRVVENALSLLGGYIHYSKTDVSYLPVKGRAIVTGVRLELEQVVINLLTNAIEAMSGLPKKGIEVSIFHEKEYICCEIADKGPKIADGDYEGMFNLFYSTKANGLGMGLAMVKSIIERHGGRVNARSNAPTGSVFAFMLPIAQCRDD